MQPIDLIGSPRRSAVACLDDAGALVTLELADRDDDLLAALPGDAAWLCVDAPLAVPNLDGSRDAEKVLAWCDVPAFPVSRRRLERVHGGARGVDLAPSLARSGRAVRETLPDLVLRELEWERQHPPGAPAMDLADYRPASIGVRAPVYRPKGRGRARPAGLQPAGRCWRASSTSATGRRARTGTTGTRCTTPRGSTPSAARTPPCASPGARARPRSATPRPATSPSRRTRTCAAAWSSRSGAWVRRARSGARPRDA